MNNCPDRRSTFSVGKKSTAQSQQISHCAEDISHGSFAPPFIDAGVEPGLCAIARPDAISPGGRLQDTAVALVEMRSRSLLVTTTVKPTLHLTM